MPARILVALDDIDADRRFLPRHSGPALYAAVLAAIRDRVGSSLAQSIHDARPKPISLSPLLDECDRIATVDSGEIRFEVGVLIDELVPCILQALCGSRLRVNRCLFRTKDIIVADEVRWDEMFRVATVLPIAWALQYVTPVAISEGRPGVGRKLLPSPEPDLVLRSLEGRLRALHPFGHEPSIVNASRLVVIAESSLVRTEHLVLAADSGRNRPRAVWRGSVGYATYELSEPDLVENRDHAWLDLLFRLSYFSGVGSRTNVGMGVTRHLRADAPAPVRR